MMHLISPGAFPPGRRLSHCAVLAEKRLSVRVCHPCEDFCPSKMAGVARLLTVAIRAGSNNGRTSRDGNRNARWLAPGLTQNVM